jgi:hypothetical protein
VIQFTLTFLGRKRDYPHLQAGVEIEYLSRNSAGLDVEERSKEETWVTLGLFT